MLTPKSVGFNFNYEPPLAILESASFERVFAQVGIPVDAAKAWVHRLMDVLWPEVHREVHSSIMIELGEKLGQYDEPWKEDDEQLVQWHDSPLRYLRGRLLYNVYPYDPSNPYSNSNPSP